MTTYRSGVRKVCTERAMAHLSARSATGMPNRHACSTIPAANQPPRESYLTTSAAIHPALPKPKDTSKMFQMVRSIHGSSDRHMLMPARPSPEPAQDRDVQLSRSFMYVRQLGRRVTCLWP